MALSFSEQAHTYKVVVIEWDGAQPPTKWYDRLKAMGLKTTRNDAAGETAQGVLSRRDEGKGLIIQEGCFIVHSQSLANLIAGMAQDLGAENVHIGECTLSSNFTQTREDAQVMAKMESKLGKRGRPPKKKSWTIACKECGSVSSIFDSRVVNCPKCNGLLFHVRKGGLIAYKDPGGDVFEAWKRIRFAGSHWEPAEVDFSNKRGAKAPAIKNINLSPKASNAIDKIANSPDIDYILGLDRDVAFDILDGVYMARALRSYDQRNTNRLAVFGEFVFAGGDATKISITDKNADLVDAAVLLGKEKTVAWIIDKLVSPQVAQAS